MARIELSQVPNAPRTGVNLIQANPQAASIGSLGPVRLPRMNFTAYAEAFNPPLIPRRDFVEGQYDSEIAESVAKGFQGIAGILKNFDWPVKKTEEQLAEDEGSLAQDNLAALTTQTAIDSDEPLDEKHRKIDKDFDAHDLELASRDYPPQSKAKLFHRSRHARRNAHIQVGHADFHKKLSIGGDINFNRALQYAQQGNLQSALSVLNKGYDAEYYSDQEFLDRRAIVAEEAATTEVRDWITAQPDSVIDLLDETGEDGYSYFPALSAGRREELRQEASVAKYDGLSATFRNFRMRLSTEGSLPAMDVQKFLENGDLNPEEFDITTFPQPSDPDAYMRFYHDLKKNIRQYQREDDLTGQQLAALESQLLGFPQEIREELGRTLDRKTQSGTQGGIVGHVHDLLEDWSGQLEDFLFGDDLTFPDTWEGAMRRGKEIKSLHGQIEAEAKRKPGISLEQLRQFAVDLISPLRERYLADHLLHSVGHRRRRRSEPGPDGRWKKGVRVAATSGSGEGLTLWPSGPGGPPKEGVILSRRELKELTGSENPEAAKYLPVAIQVGDRSPVVSRIVGYREAESAPAGLRQAVGAASRDSGRPIVEVTHGLLRTLRGRTQRDNRGNVIGVTGVSSVAYLAADPRRLVQLDFQQNWEDLWHQYRELGVSIAGGSFGTLAELKILRHLHAAYQVQTRMAAQVEV